MKQLPLLILISYIMIIEFYFRISQKGDMNFSLTLFKNMNTLYFYPFSLWKFSSLLCYLHE
jgi:hypothetical protein